MSTHESNVFRSPDNPLSDVVTSVLPRLGAGLRVSRLQFDVDLSAPYTRYGRYRTEGQPGVQASLRSSLFLNRSSLFVEGTYDQSKGRQLADIDQRITRQTDSLTAGASIGLSSRTALELAAGRSRSRFGSEVVDDVVLGRDLGQDRDRATVAVRRSLTPLTDVRILIEARRDRFGGDPLRNSDEQRVSVSLDSTALLRGQGAVGFSRFEPQSASLPRYTGVVADVGFEFPITGRTFVGLTALRDVGYSFQSLRPYYVQTAITANFTQGLTPALAAQVAAGHQELAYRAVADSSVGGLRDRMRSLSGGLSWRIGQRLSLTASVVMEDRAAGVRPAFTNRLSRVMVSYVF